MMVFDVTLTRTLNVKCHVSWGLGMLNWTSAPEISQFYYHFVTVGAIDFYSHMSTRVEEGS